MLLARRLVNGRERGCLQVVSCSVLRLVNMSTRAMRLKTQARALACLQVVYLTLSVVKEQSFSVSLVRLEKNCSHYILGEDAAGSRVSKQPMPRSHIAIAAKSAMTDRADYPLRTLRLCDSALKSQHSDEIPRRICRARRTNAAESGILFGVAADGHCLFPAGM